MMKKAKLLLTTFLFVGILTIAFGQNNVFPTSGNVGIGTGSITESKLHVQISNEGVKSAHGTVLIEDSRAQLDLLSSDDETWGSAINFMKGNSLGTGTTDLWSFVRRSNLSNSDFLLLSFGDNLNPAANTQMMRFNTDGLVEIGKTGGTSQLTVYHPNAATAAFTVAVNGGTKKIEFYGNGDSKFDGLMKVEEVNVQADVWSDFVFDASYDLLSLKEVENYIDENGHLPGVPSTDEVLKNGINVAETDALLLQKIEELTLYVIELKKENETQNKLIKKLTKSTNK